MFHMKQSEIIHLAMERVVALMREEGTTDEERRVLDQQLRTLARLFVYAQDRERNG
jgi:hypothetical protein